MGGNVEIALLRQIHSLWPAAGLGIAIGIAARLGRLASHALGDPPEFWSVDGVFRFVLCVATLPPLLSAG